MSGDSKWGDLLGNRTGFMEGLYLDDPSLAAGAAADEAIRDLIGRDNLAKIREQYPKQMLECIQIDPVDVDDEAPVITYRRLTAEELGKTIAAQEKAAGQGRAIDVDIMVVRTAVVFPDWNEMQRIIGAMPLLAGKLSGAIRSFTEGGNFLRVRVPRAAASATGK